MVANLQDVLYGLFLLHCLLVVDVVGCSNDANLDRILLLEVDVDKDRLVVLG